MSDCSIKEKYPFVYLSIHFYSGTSIININNNNILAIPSELMIARRIIYAFARRYTKSHEWVDFDQTKKTATIGISNYAQEQLGELIHVELPSVGKNYNAGDSVVVLESVKIAADVYTPFAGAIKAVNKDLEGNASKINEAAETTWLVELTCENEPAGLLSADEYKALLAK